PYDGPRGIAAVLEVLEGRGFAAEREDGHVIALDRGEERITLEPGGQIELSGPALVSAEAGSRVLVSHLQELREVGRPLGIHFITGGFRPFGTLDDVPWLPKRRYTVMRDYLPRRGRLGHEMMKRTATVQANLDFSDEANATSKIRRALDVPMFFVVRDGVYHPVGGITFRRFLEQGWQGQRATRRDWEVHLSTLFPEVRLKRYIEVRGADSAPLPMAQALAALWRGLLDDDDARAAAWALVEPWPYVDRLRLRREVPAGGLSVRVGNRTLAELAVELVRIARDGLSRLPEGAGDQPLLDPVMAYARAGRCPADDMLDDFAAANGDPRKLVAAWEFKA